MGDQRRLEPLARAVLRSQPDGRLVALAREGREPAFEEIVRRYRPGLVPFAAAYAPSAQAEDVVQESLIRAWNALRKSDSETEIHLRAWLYTIVRNRALNARRDTRVHEQNEQIDETIDGVRRPEEHLLAKEELDRVVGAVGSLPESQRTALVRSSLDGRRHEEIAAELGTSPGAVRQLIFRARSTLREGVGLFVPLPIVRALTEIAAAPAGAVAGGAGAGIAASAGGTSLATKLLAVAAVGAAGAGIAIDRDRSERNGTRTVTEVTAAERAASPAATASSLVARTVAAGPRAGSGGGGQPATADRAASTPAAATTPSTAGSGELSPLGEGEGGESRTATTTAGAQPAPTDDGDGHQPPPGPQQPLGGGPGPGPGDGSHTGPAPGGQLQGQSGPGGSYPYPGGGGTGPGGGGIEGGGTSPYPDPGTAPPYEHRGTFGATSYPPHSGPESPQGFGH